MFPWKKLERKTSKTFIELKTWAVAHVGKVKDDIFKTLSQDRRSNQIKHNRLKADIMELQSCFAKERAAYRKEVDEKEIRAAEEAEKNAK